MSLFRNPNLTLDVSKTLWSTEGSQRYITSRSFIAWMLVNSMSALESNGEIGLTLELINANSQKLEAGCLKKNLCCYPRTASLDLLPTPCLQYGRALTGRFVLPRPIDKALSQQAPSGAEGNYSSLGNMRMALDS